MHVPLLLALTLVGAGALPGPSGQGGAEAGGSAGPQLSPPELLADSPAVYPETLRAEGPAGQVKLELLIDARGEVETITLLEGANPAFNEAALHAATRLRFKPAMEGDHPVPVRLPFTYKFTAPVLPTGTLQGQVRTRGNRRPIPGATLYVERLGRPIETDAAGHFQVELPKGEIAVVVSAPGHKPQTFYERIRPRQSVEVIYGLDPLIVNPYETIVRSDRERTEVASVTLRDQELREVPGTMGDPFRVMMLMPGVSSIASGIAYPVVRGSLPAATGYFIDDIRVPLLFHLFLGPAVVHPDFLETVDFYPGVPPPEYGRLLAGVADGKISHARDDRLHGTVYADFINAGFFVELPIQETRTNVSLAARLSYTPWLIALATNAQKQVSALHTRSVLDFYDYQLRVEQRLGPGTLRLFAFGSSDVGGARATGSGGITTLLSLIFHRVDLRYRQQLGVGELEAGVTAGPDLLGLDVDFPSEIQGVPLPPSTFKFSLNETSYVARASWKALLRPGLKLQVGADVDRRQARLSEDGQIPSQPGSPSPSGPVHLEEPTTNATFTGVWGQAVWTPTSRLALIPGARVDSYHLVPGIDYLVAEPRLTARYELTPSLTLKGGAGLYHQPPITLINLPAASLSSLRFGLQEAIQTDVGAEWKPFEGLETSVDAFVNPLLRTHEIALPAKLQFPLLGDDDTIRNQVSHGYAYGVDLLIRHPLGGNWFGWLSGSYLRSVRYRTFDAHDELGEVVGTRSAYVPFAYDQTFVFNAVLSYKLPGGWTLGGVAHFNTGLPETGEVTSLTHVAGVDRTGAPAWIPVDLDKAARLPPFFRLDVRASKTWVYDDFTLEAYLDVLNATFSKEVQGYSYLQTQSGALVKLAQTSPLVLPSLGLKASY